MAAWHLTGRDPYTSPVHASCMGLDVLTAASMRVRKERAAQRPGSAHVFREFKSFKHLTVEDLKADPMLLQALRSLHATIGHARPHTAPSSRPLTAPHIQAIRAVTPTAVAHDINLRANLQKLKARTDLIGTRRAGHKFSAVGESAHVGASIRARGLPFTPHAGRDSIASIGPGCNKQRPWASNSEHDGLSCMPASDTFVVVARAGMGPHRLMESHRRPLGPGKR